MSLLLFLSFSSSFSLPTPTTIWGLFLESGCKLLMFHWCIPAKRKSGQRNPTLVCISYSSSGWFRYLVSGLKWHCFFPDKVGTLISDLQCPKLWDNKFLLFRPPNHVVFSWWPKVSGYSTCTILHLDLQWMKVPVATSLPVFTMVSILNFDCYHIVKNKSKNNKEMRVTLNYL